MASKREVKLKNCPFCKSIKEKPYLERDGFIISTTNVFRGIKSESCTAPTGLEIVESYGISQWKEADNEAAQLP
jgi:hypothetical protein